LKMRFLMTRADHAGTEVPDYREYDLL
jgi:hypothetical protein